TAVAASALTFALWHGTVAWFTVMNTSLPVVLIIPAALGALVVVFAGGLVMAALRVATGTLATSVAAHWVFNAVILVGLWTDRAAVLVLLVAAGHELSFITARAERRRYITETWLREKGIFDHAKAVHLKPMGDFRPEYPRGRYDPAGSAEYKVRLAKELELDA